MKTITRYQCEICARIYDTAAEATACEAQGEPPDYPRGLILELDSDLYRGMTFAIAGSTLDRHARHLHWWACRDRGHGDSLGDEHCGHIVYARQPLSKFHAVRDFTAPHFLRMVTHLRSWGIEPLVWDGEKAVPLEGQP